MRHHHRRCLPHLLLPLLIFIGAAVTRVDASSILNGVTGLNGPLANGPTVTVEPWTRSEVTFDPSKPPGEPGGPPTSDGTPAGTPLIGPDEAGFAKYDLNLKGTGFEFTKNPDGSVTLTSAQTTATGNTTIYLPDTANAQLKGHEDAHHDLQKQGYDEAALQSLTEALNGLSGQKFPDEAALKKAVQDALTRALAGLRQKIDGTDNKLDRLTNHGRNDQVDPRSGKPVGTKKALKMIANERKDAPPAGSKPKEPKKKPKGGTAEDPARVFFDDATGRISFGGDLEILFAEDPFDTIIGRGRFEFDPLVVIGLMANGAVHLSDTAMRIVDTLTGERLLDGYLIEVAWMPPSLTGSTGRIQGFLDIPPDFAGGTHNTIGSAMLTTLSEAAANRQWTAVWFYADAPLFDAAGGPLISEDGVTGQVKTDAAEPALNLLLLTALGAYGAEVRRRQRGAR